MSYTAKTYNVQRLAMQLTYWGAFTITQASYYLEHFYHVENASNLIDNYCTNRQLCYLHGNKDIISISNFPYLTFSKGKEKCIWVYFSYLDSAIKKRTMPKIITKNEFQGIDFTLSNRYYSLVYISGGDKTYYSILKTKHDEAKSYIFVVDSDQRAAEIKKVNTDDIIWVVNDETIRLYEGGA